MPPKPQVFKAPDGKEFTSKKEWREYMVSVFYSFKNKKDEPTPLVKLPGEIDGQIFEIAECTNTTMVVMDNSEQVQIDNCSGCRVFIAACSSSVFIRNCKNCVFYVCCQQLRVTETEDSTLYVLSIAEVHIEICHGLSFAPFNGSYPQHGEHLRKANLNPANNLWYDIYDHSDTAKTNENWRLLPESDYEQPWFPAGSECEYFVPKVKVGSVVKVQDNGNMQSFGVDQMKKDAEKSASTSSASGPPALPPPIPAVESPPPTTVTSTSNPSAAGGVVVSEDEQAIRSIVQLFSSANDVSSLVEESFSWVSSSGAVGDIGSLHQLLTSANPIRNLLAISSLRVSALGDMALAVFSVQSNGGEFVDTYTIALAKSLVTGLWKIIHAHVTAPGPTSA